jgi:hypothetical protein
VIAVLFSARSFSHSAPNLEAALYAREQEQEQEGNAGCRPLSPVAPKHQGKHWFRKTTGFTMNAKRFLVLFTPNMIAWGGWLMGT